METPQGRQLAAKIGFWSGLLTVITFIVFTVCFIVVYTQEKPVLWSGIDSFAAHAQAESGSFFKALAQVSMVIFGPLYVIMLNSLSALVAPEKKSLMRIAVDFGLAFAVLSSLHYFVQVTVVRWNIANGQTAGLEQFVQSNPTSFILAANMLGWTLFFGLSSLFAAFALGVSKPERIPRAALLVNGVSCLAGGVGFVTQNAAVVFVTMNFLMGGAVLVFAGALCIMCVRDRKQALP